ncbi:hypothetical protein [Bradyrhizobium jicamae]|uniref:hypothetical protein n=1 Tax=Bradyrhizobium jicamae TaxID=280332 RepID=UPI001BA937A2|nr:hypothetical protein [Bradyrhizobium jicamae]MBR0936689.1 hypothetical protein [Bradyrhizobium jicamae]
MTTVSHVNLSSHSSPFSLAGSMVSASLSGTIADLIDPPELVQLVSGQWLSMNPPLRWLNGEKGGTKQAKFMSTATAFRWTVPTGGHSITTNVVSA